MFDCTQGNHFNMDATYFPLCCQNMSENKRLTCLYLLHDALFVVVAQGAAQLVVVHCWPVFLNAPATSHLTQQKERQIHQTHISSVITY